MPVNIPDNLPAAEVLAAENIFTMNRTSAVHQDIRPLKIAIVNLMPLKETTELSFLRLLSNNPLQIEIDLIRTESYLPSNTNHDHLFSFYRTFDDIKAENYDGLIITGAPVEHLDFHEVKYWEEMKTIMNWAKQHVTSTLYVCWAAQAGLFYHYGIHKHMMDKKLFGVFEHQCPDKKHPLVRGFDEHYFVPHSRYSKIRIEDMEQNDELELLSISDDAGINIVGSRDHRSFFITGHFEYQPETLQLEYFRDIDKGLKTDIPFNYFPDNNPENSPNSKWRAHANLLFSNWLNFFVYQETPYELEELPTLFN